MGSVEREEEETTQILCLLNPLRSRWILSEWLILLSCLTTWEKEKTMMQEHLPNCYICGERGVIKCACCGQSACSKHWRFSNGLLCMECEELSSKLIKCPDCSKEVSRRASSCPHCGFPISGLPEDQLIPITASQHQRINISTPKCPTCQSDSIQKISTSNKVGKIALFGIFAIGKISKTFKCNNCGYQW